MSHRFNENVLFFREFLRHFRMTGAVLPSGRQLASVLAGFVDVDCHTPRKILEVGPGTGAVTRRIIAAMRPNDRLDLVELNDTFVAQLNRRFQHDPKFKRVADRSRVLHCPVEELSHDDRYDLIVSGLPLNNFTVAQVEQILAVLTGLLADGGTLSFFEYIGVRKVRAVVSSRPERERLRGIDRAMRAVLDNREIRRDAVLFNVPPAWVHHVRG